MMDNLTNEAQLSPTTPQVIRELKHYQPFSFAHSLQRARGICRHENRAIGVFTSGDDAPGKHSMESVAIFLFTGWPPTGKTWRSLGI